MVLQIATNWRNGVRGVLITLASFMLFAGCSNSPKYEETIEQNT